MSGPCDAALLILSIAALPIPSVAALLQVPPGCTPQNFGVCFGGRGGKRWEKGRDNKCVDVLSVLSKPHSSGVAGMKCAPTLSPLLSLHRHQTFRDLSRFQSGNHAAEAASPQAPLVRERE